MLVYTVKITFTPTNIRIATTYPQYTAYTVTVGCILTGIANMDGSTLNAEKYKIYTNNAMIVDFSTSTISPNTQSPLCGFALTKTYAYSNGTGCTANFCYDTSIFIGGTDGKLTVSTTNATKVGTYKVNVTQTVTDTFSTLYKTSTAAGGSPAGN